MKIHFFDTVEKYGIDSTTNWAKLTGNRKMKIPKSIGKTNEKRANRRPEHVNLERF